MLISKLYRRILIIRHESLPCEKPRDARARGKKIRLAAGPPTLSPLKRAILGNSCPPATSSQHPPLASTHTRANSLSFQEKVLIAQNLHICIKLKLLLRISGEDFCRDSLCLIMCLCLVVRITISNFMCQGDAAPEVGLKEMLTEWGPAGILSAP